MNEAISNKKYERIVNHHINGNFGDLKKLINGLTKFQLITLIIKFSDDNNTDANQKFIKKLFLVLD